MKKLNENVKGEFGSIRFNYSVKVEVEGGISCTAIYYVYAFIENGQIKIEKDLTNFEDIKYLQNDISGTNMWKQFFDYHESLGIDMRQKFTNVADSILIDDLIKEEHKQLFDFMVMNITK